MTGLACEWGSAEPDQSGLSCRWLCAQVWELAFPGRDAGTEMFEPGLVYARQQHGDLGTREVHNQ